MYLIFYVLYLMFSVLNISFSTILFYIYAVLQQYEILKIISLSGNRLLLTYLLTFVTSLVISTSRQTFLGSYLLTWVASMSSCKVWTPHLYKWEDEVFVNCKRGWKMFAVNRGQTTNGGGGGCRSQIKKLLQHFFLNNCCLRFAAFDFELKFSLKYLHSLKHSG